MKPKTMILMIVAVACGLVASYMTSRLIAERNANADDKPMVKVLVAKKKLKAMTALAKPEDLLVEKEIPQDMVPKKAVTSFEGLKDKRVNKIINEEAFLTQDDLVTKDTMTLDWELPPGYRAIGMKVNPECLAGGFILPRSRVDVISVTREGEAEAKIILQDMLVLAVDMSSEREIENGKARLGSTVTLAALPEEATRLTLASGLGELRLLLRRQEEHDKLTLKGSTRKDLSKPLAVPGGETGNQEGSTTVASATVKIPELPDVPTPTQPAAAPNVEPVKPEEPAGKVHKMTLVIGDSVQKVEFVQARDGSWDQTKGGMTRRDLDEPREPRQPRQPRPAPGKPLLEQGGKEQPQAQPETLTDKLLKNSGLPPVPPLNKDP